ncbi:MAG: DUF447 family protein [Chromatiales bacterium]|nr:DUF447 family protein [Chromatiales bacterium]
MKILETIVATCNENGSTHLAPMGVWEADSYIVLAPFRPSKTLDNLMRVPYAVINRIDDVRVFAGCLSGRKTWPLIAVEQMVAKRLAVALSHMEVKIVKSKDDEVRPKLYAEVLHEAIHAPFVGFNRAQFAVIELAILVSRLDRLPPEKILAEIDYLKIALDKTAGANELEAWSWLMECVEQKLQLQSDTS